MSALITILIFIVCALLAIVVLIQNPKGGGLDSSFGSAAQLGGVKKTTDFLEKSTWTLAGVLVVLCLLSVGVGGEIEKKEGDGKFRDEAPVAPQSAPAQQQQQQAPAEQPAQ